MDPVNRGVALSLELITYSFAKCRLSLENNVLWNSSGADGDADSTTVIKFCNGTCTLVL